MPTKICSLCGEKKDTYSFNPDPTTPDSLNPVCKNCEHKQKLDQLAKQFISTKKKYCPYCNTDQPLTNFTIKNTKSGQSYHTWCKTCYNKYIALKPKPTPNQKSLTEIKAEMITECKKYKRPGLRGINTEYNIRYCTSCKRVLPFTDFPKNKNKINGLASSCKECTNNAQNPKHQTKKPTQHLPQTTTEEPHFFKRVFKTISSIFST
ncbi:hypothetical protein [Bacteroides sp.]|uniref:hypothetical protein n=1 Tax=Bacteroides sp. TaxID=29523 RepID=UPI00260212C2|nr:hypothetical protein [Bacteroides sp.]MDD3039066.1 hypothetical protein [Bacteroides sp.]